MEKIDITKNELYLTNITRVIKSYILEGKTGDGKKRAMDGFILITKGRCRYDFIDGESFTAKQGDLLYLAKDSVYKMDVCCTRYDFIFCDFEFVCDKPRKSATYPLRNFDEASLIFNKLLLCFEAKRTGYASDCASLLYKIYSETVKSAATYSAPKSKELAYKAQSCFIEKLSSPSLSVEDVAIVLGITPTHLRRVFASVFGVSPVKYVNNLRVLRAKELMTQSYLTLSDVAEQCGYASLPYFCRIFKQTTGETPDSYRKKLTK